MPLSPCSASGPLSDDDSAYDKTPEGSPPPPPPPFYGKAAAAGGNSDLLAVVTAPCLFPMVDATALEASSSPAALAPASCSVLSDDSASDVFGNADASMQQQQQQQQQQQKDKQDSSMALSALVTSPWLPSASASAPALSALTLSPTQETRPPPPSPPPPPPPPPPGSSSSPPSPPPPRFAEATSMYTSVADFMERRLTEGPALVAATAPPQEMPEALSSLTSSEWSSSSWSASSSSMISTQVQARALFDDLRGLHFRRCAKLFPNLLADWDAAAAAAADVDAAAPAAASRRPSGRGPARPLLPQARQPPPPLQLVFAHNCRFLGCHSAACDVCRFNPRKACRRSLPRRSFAGDSVTSGCAAMLSVEAVVHPSASPAAAAAAAALLHDACVELTVVDSGAFCRSRDLREHWGQLANRKLMNEKKKKKNAAGEGRAGGSGGGEIDVYSDSCFSSDDEGCSDDDEDDDASAGNTSTDEGDDDDADDISEDANATMEATAGEAAASPAPSIAAAAAAAFAAAAADPADEAGSDAMGDDENGDLERELSHVPTPSSPFPALGVFSVAASAPPATSPLSMSLLAALMASERKSAPLACIPIVDVVLPASVAIERLAASKKKEKKGLRGGRGRGSSSVSAAAAAAAADKDEDGSTATLRLVARLVRADGAPLPGTRPAVSEPFSVASRRAKSLQKRDFPSPDDCATTIEHVGWETFRRLSELGVAARARNQEQGQQQGGVDEQGQRQQQRQQLQREDELVASPEANALAELLPADLQSFSTVGDLLRLASAAALSAQLRRALPPFLGVSTRKVAAMARHARRALRADDRLRAWFSPGMTEALLFSCHGGGVRPDLPIAVLCLRPDAASPRALRAASRLEQGLLPRAPPADEALSPAHCWRAAAASEGGDGLRLVVDGGRRVRFPGLAVASLFLVQDLSWDQRMDVERACNLAVDSWWSRGHPGWKVFSMGGKYFTSVVTVQCYLEAIAAGIPLPGESRALERPTEMPSSIAPSSPFQSVEAAALEPEGVSGSEADSGFDSGEDGPGSEMDEDDEDDDDDDDEDDDDDDEDEDEDAFAAAIAAARAGRDPGQLFPPIDELSPACDVRSADIAELASHVGFVDIPPQLRAAFAAMTARRAPQHAGGSAAADSGSEDDDFGDADDDGEQPRCRSVRVPAEALESLASLSALGTQLRDAEAGGDSEGRARLRAEALARFAAGAGPPEAVSEVDMPGTPEPALSCGAAAAAAAAAASFAAAAAADAADAADAAVTTSPAGTPASSLVREHHRRLFASLRTLVSSVTDVSPAPAQCARVAECLRHVTTLEIPGPQRAEISEEGEQEQRRQQRLADPVANSRAAAAAAAAAASPRTPGNSAAVAAARGASYSGSDSGEDATAATAANAAAAAGGSSPSSPPVLAACDCANNLSSSSSDEDDDGDGDDAAAAAAFAAALAAPVATPNRSNVQHPLAALGTSLSVPAATAGTFASSEGGSAAGAAAAAAAAAPIFYARAPRGRDASPASSDIAHLLSAGAPPSFLVAGAAAAADNVSCAVGARRFAAAGAAAAGFEEDDDCASS